ncbi:hypothetical protein JV173_02740 [Acholeplasma equirhinis]|uniref:ABC transporter permease n=1 Tax=Acholeplasma equirhinis TaxID=555393 RepID=UPI00197A76EB|nr:hypothetical protein [Acholeplasma equirhinis]MBN3490426.1 hypothetical protein [Acholeplasma equirhinis]
MKLRRLRKYWAFSKGGILSGFAYKFSAFGWLLGDIVSLLILYFLWSAIYANSPVDVINGMTFNEMVTYLIYARIASTLVFSSISFWIVGEDIYEGGIALSLIRPMSYRYRILASSFGNFLSTIILLFIPLFFVANGLLYFVLGVDLPNILNLLLFVVSAILSFIISDHLGFLIGEIAIFTNALFGLMLIRNIMLSFLSGSLLPSAFFPEWLQITLKFLPFQSMIENPILILMGRIQDIDILYTILIQFVWVLVLGFLCNLSFNKLKKHIVSVGG